MKNHYLADCPLVRDQNARHGIGQKHQIGRRIRNWRAGDNLALVPGEKTAPGRVEHRVAGHPEIGARPMFVCSGDREHRLKLRLEHLGQVASRLGWNCVATATIRTEQVSSGRDEVLVDFAKCCRPHRWLQLRELRFDVV